MVLPQRLSQPCESTEKCNADHYRTNQTKGGRHLTEQNDPKERPSDSIRYRKPTAPRPVWRVRAKLARNEDPHRQLRMRCTRACRSPRLPVEFGLLAGSDTFTMVHAEPRFKAASIVHSAAWFHPSLMTLRGADFLQEVDASAKS
jgi:hypothetical protein